MRSRIDDPDLVRRARDSTDRFVDREGQFQLGMLRNERPHPCTRTFNMTLPHYPWEGVAMRLSVDRDIRPVARRVSLDAVRSTGSRDADSGRPRETDLLLQLRQHRSPERDAGRDVALVLGRPRAHESGRGIGRGAHRVASAGRGGEGGVRRESVLQHHDRGRFGR